MEPFKNSKMLFKQEKPNLLINISAYSEIVFSNAGSTHKEFLTVERP